MVKFDFHKKLTKAEIHKIKAEVSKFISNGLEKNKEDLENFCSNKNYNIIIFPKKDNIILVSII